MNELVSEDIAISREVILNDYRLICESRQASLLGRKDVMGGRAKFGIFGDGKELAQIAMAKAFRKGDFRSGYYRDQTVVVALENLHWRDFFFSALWASRRCLRPQYCWSFDEQSLYY